jgi:hypothetical protein
MAKNTYFSGHPIFTQLLKYVNPAEVNRIARQAGVDQYYKKFRGYEHLVTMLYCCFNGCKSIREVVTGMQVAFNKLQHLGMKSVPRRSTLADANKARSEEFFGKLYHNLYSRFYKNSPDSRKKKSGVYNKLFVIDSTTIQLFSDVMKGMGTKPVSGRAKGGAKAHVLMKAEEDVPRFVDLTHATKNDKVILDQITLEPGSIVVFDKGYNNYKKLDEWNNSKVTWVTRIQDVASFTVKKILPVSDYAKKKGVLSDEVILMGRLSNTTTVKITARKIKYFHQESKKMLTFITNNMNFSPLTIADIYKERWQIEIFFKRIKHSYPLRYFLGDTENAIKIQIWCALITDLLVKIVQDKVHRKWSYANIASMIKLHLMSYVDIFKFLNNPEKALINYREQRIDNQLSFCT